MAIKQPSVIPANVVIKRIPAWKSGIPPKVVDRIVLRRLEAASNRNEPGAQARALAFATCVGQEREAAKDTTGRWVQPSETSSEGWGGPIPTWQRKR